MASEPIPTEPATSPTGVDKLAWGLWALYALIGATLYVVFLDVGNLWNTDDALYGQVVRQFVDQGDTTLAWYGDPMVQAYPLGLHWMALISRVAGTGVFGLRLSSALAALTGLVLLGLWRTPGRRWLAQPALYAGALLAAQPLYYVLSQRVMHDSLMSALIIGALGLHLRAEESEGYGYRLGAGLLAGLTSLVKLGAGVLPLAVIGLHLLSRERRLWREPWSLAELGVGVTVPGAYLLITGRLGSTVEHLLARFSGLEGVGDDAGAGSSAFVTVTDQGWMGIVLVVLAILGAAVAARRRGSLDRLGLIWTVVSVAVMAAMHTRIAHYALQLVLPMSILGGLALAEGVSLIARSRAHALTALVPILATASLFLTQDTYFWVHAKDADIAELSAVMAEAPPDTYLCTIDVYHTLPVFETRRPLEYLTEHAYSRRVLQGTFSERTVPTLDHQGVLDRLSDAGGFVCLIPQQRLATYPELRASAIEVLSPSVPSPEGVVLIRRP